MKVKFSIRYKFLAVCTALLVVCVGAYLWMASSKFTEDKRQWVFSYNQSIVSNTSRDVERLIRSLSDKLHLVAVLKETRTRKQEQLVDDILSKSKELVYVGVSSNFKNITKDYYLDEVYFKTYGLSNSEFIKKVTEDRPIPFSELQVRGEYIWNSTGSMNLPLLGFGKVVVIENENGIPVDQFAIVAVFKADSLIRSLEHGQMNDVVILRNDGEVLVHKDIEKLKTKELYDDPIFQQSKGDQVKIKVAQYSYEGENYLGAYAKELGGDVVVVSKVSERKAFAVVNRLLISSLLFGSTILTLAFIFAVLFSRSITKPLDSMMARMRQVSEGDLSANIKVETRDELALVAYSFNRMIRDLKQSREELEKINSELEEKVRERTKQLEEQNLAVKEAQEALLRSTRLAAVGEVAGQAAHQVLNPLTSIISRLRKLRTRMEDDRAKEAALLLDIEKSWEKDFSEGGFQKLVKSWSGPSGVKAGATLWDEDLSNVKTIGENLVSEYKNLVNDTDFLIGESERISRIINSFRSLSSVGGEVKPLSIHKLCEQSIKIMNDLAIKDKIDLKLECKAENDVVMIDEDEFIQVMTNLIRNALHACRNLPRSGKVTVLTEKVDSFIHIVIKDNGTGIPAKFHSQLFEKNFTTKSKNDGTGIGLPISRRLIRAFKGDITLKHTQEDVGSEFLIKLPLAAQSSGSQGAA